MKKTPKDFRACPECGEQCEATGDMPGAYYCSACDDVMIFDGEAEAEAEEG